MWQGRPDHGAGNAARIFGVRRGSLFMMAESDQIISPGVVQGPPRVWLRFEAAAALSVAIALYVHGGHSWVWFAILFFVPDLTFAGYLAGPAVGAVCYNIVHSYVLPVLLAGILYWMGKSMAVPLIWIAHIGMDRTIGYGLKYGTGFGYTHLGLLGKTVRD